MGNMTGSKRAVFGAVHLRIDIAVNIIIEYACGCDDERYPREHREKGAELKWPRSYMSCEKESGNSRECIAVHDTRLTEVVIEFQHIVLLARHVTLGVAICACSRSAQSRARQPCEDPQSDTPSLA